MIWELCGYALAGGVLGYICRRWLVVRLALYLVLAVSLIVNPTPPIQPIGPPGAKSWANVVALTVGAVVGTLVAYREKGAK